MTSDQVKILDLEARVEDLERAGDALAHDLTIAITSAPVLDVWWKLRRNSDCHVCCPREKAAQHFWSCPHYPSAIENFGKGRKACDTCKDDGVYVPRQPLPRARPLDTR